MSVRLNLTICAVAACLAYTTLAGVALADGDDRANPFVGSSNQPDTSTSGSFFGLFESGETQLSRFERPSSGYAALTARRSDSLRLQNAKGAGLVSEPETEAYLNGVLAKILAANGLGDLAPRVYLHSDDGAQAHCTPDGGIYVSHQLVQVLQNENEVAFLLAHEVSHFLLQHHDADWFVTTQSRMLTGVETLRTLGDGIAQQVGQSDSAMAGKLQKAVQIGAVIYDISDNVLFSAWGREQEQEADRLGLDLMVGAGYYPYDAEGVMSVMADYEKAQEQNRDNANALLNSRSAEAFGLDEGMIRSNPLLNGIAGGLGEMIAKLGSDHYPALERSEDIFDYNEKHYSDVPVTLEVATPWEASADHPLNTLVANYKAASGALEELANGNLNRAESLARQGVGGLTEHHAFPRVAFQRVRRAQNQKSKAEQNLKLAQADGKTPTIIYFEYIDLENEQRDYGSILDLVALAERDAGGTLPQLMPYLVYAYRALGQAPKAFEMQKTCEVERPEMQRSCKKAAQGEYPGTPPVAPKQAAPGRSVVEMPWRNK